MNDLHQITDCWEFLTGRAHPHICLGQYMNKLEHPNNIAIGLALQAISGNLDCCLLCEEAKKLIGVAAFALYA